MSDFFDWVNSVSETKKNLVKEGRSINEYLPFMVNMAMSYFPDSILYANEMNLQHHLSKQVQYDYLLSSLRARKRRSKWFKKTVEEQKTIDAIAQYMQLSPRKVIQIMHLIPEEEQERMRLAIDGRD